MLFSGKLSLEMRMGITLLFLLATLVLVYFGVDRLIYPHLASLGPLAPLLTGAFYTFGSTTPFSMVMIIELMEGGNPFVIAVAACAAAATVDCILFSMVRDALEKSVGRLREKLKIGAGPLAPAYPIFGFLIFGSPLPDELALVLMSVTRIRPVSLWLVVFFSKLFTLLMLWRALVA